MIRRPPRSTLSSSSAASDVYKRQGYARAWTLHVPAFERAIPPQRDAKAISALASKSEGVSITLSSDLYAETAPFNATSSDHTEPFFDKNDSTQWAMASIPVRAVKAGVSVTVSFGSTTA